MNACGGLVLDTSVWINLLATEQPWTILQAFGSRYFTPEAVVAEVKRNPVTQQLYSDARHPLRRHPNLEVVELKGEELDLFLSLVGQHPIDGLGDGEAAAIAVAVTRQLAVALDERKARRIMRERFPGIAVVMSVDILRNPSVRMALGEEGFSAAFEKAKQFGKMHVPKNA